MAYVAPTRVPLAASIVAADSREPFLAVVLRLHPGRIASLLLDTGPATGPPDEHSPSAISVGHAPPPP